jgi:hypothetical protein
MRGVSLAALALSLVISVMACRASAAPTWLGPFSLTSPTPDVGPVSIGFDRRGDALAVWTSESAGSSVVQARGRPAGGEWTAPYDLSRRVDDTGGVDVAVNGAGDAVAVWAVFMGSYWTVDASTRPAGGDWKPPQGLWFGKEPDYGAGVGDVRVALNGRGDAIAVWNFVPDTGIDHLDVAVRPAGNGWSAPKRLTQRLFGSPDVSLDAAGNAVVLWSEGDVTGPRPVIKAVRHSARGSWTTPTLVSDEGVGATGPQLAVDAAGNAVAAWLTDDGALRISRRPIHGSWSRPRTLATGLTAGDNPSLAGDAAGDAVAVWLAVERHGRQIVRWIRASTRPRRGTWSRPETIGRGFAPNVSLDAAGDAVAVWWKSRVIRTARRPAHGRWNRVKLVSSPGATAYGAKVVADGHGNALVTWDVAGRAGWWNEAAALDAAGPVFARLSIPARARIGVPVRFSVSPFDVWSSLGAPPRWSFGDGGSARGTTVTHTYRTAGAYRVRLSQSDVRGNRTSVTRSLRVGR